MSDGASAALLLFPIVILFSVLVTIIIFMLVTIIAILLATMTATISTDELRLEVLEKKVKKLKQKQKMFGSDVVVQKL